MYRYPCIIIGFRGPEVLMSWSICSESLCICSDNSRLACSPDSSTRLDGGQMGSTLDTYGAAAKVMNIDRLGKKYTTWHFWEDKNRLTGIPKRSPCRKT